MMFFLGLFQLLLTILICLFEYKKGSISLFLWGTLLLLFSIPHFLEIFIDNNLFNEKILLESSVFVILFNSLYIITRLIFSKKTTVNKREIESFNELLKHKTKFKWAIFIIFIFSFLLLIGSSLYYFGSLKDVSWGNYLNLSKDLGLFNPIKISNYLYFATSGIALVFYFQSNKKIYWLIIAICISYVFLTGNRITILPALINLIIPFIIQNKLQMKKIIVLGFFGLFAVYVLYFLRLLRIYGGFFPMIQDKNILELNNEVIHMLLTGDGELSLRNAFYYFNSINNNFPGFGEGLTYLRILLLPIPTSLSGGIKPQDFAITMGSAYTNNIANTTYSMHPTLYGDVYANFGLLGITTGIFWAFFIFFIDKLMSKQNLTIYLLTSVLFATAFIIVGRGSVYNGFLYAFIGIVIIIFTYLVTSIRIKKVRKNYEYS